MPEVPQGTLYSREHLNPYVDQVVVVVCVPRSTPVVQVPVPLCVLEDPVVPQEPKAACVPEFYPHRTKGHNTTYFYEYYPARLFWDMVLGRANRDSPVFISILSLSNKPGEGG